jgi:hypothetical protein
MQHIEPPPEIHDRGVRPPVLMRDQARLNRVMLTFLVQVDRQLTTRSVTPSKRACKALYNADFKVC